MRILIIQPWIRIGGAEIVSALLASDLERNGHRADVVCTFVDERGLSEVAKSVSYVSPPDRISRLLWRSKVAFLTLGPWILLYLVWKHSRNVDLLNPHNFPSLWVASIVGRIRGIRVLWTCNEPPTKLQLADARRVGIADYLGWLLASSPIDRICVKAVAKIHVLSLRSQRQVRELYGRDSQVLPTGVDYERFSKGLASRAVEMHELSGRFVILMVGKLHPQKNQVLGLEILKAIQSEIPTAILLIAGDGPMRKQLEEHASDIGISDIVQFLGHVPTDELADLYAASNVQLLVATDQSWGLTPFEALAAICPSIVVEDSGAAEVVRREEIGLISGATVQDFRNSILEIHHNPDKYSAVARHGRRYVERYLTHRGFARKFSGMALELISTSNRFEARGDNLQEPTES